jgi:hypothetical protein
VGADRERGFALEWLLRWGELWPAKSISPDAVKRFVVWSRIPSWPVLGFLVRRRLDW